MRHSARGLAFVDVLVTTATLAVLSALSAPAISGLHDRAQARAAARYVSGRLQAARLEALSRNTTVSVRMGDEADDYRFRLYADGDGDGVLQRDIDEGIDRPVDAGDRLADHFRDVTFRVATGVPDIGGGADVAAHTDPVRIGPTRFVSFSPLGGCTSGTLFLSGPRGPQAAVRLLGQTGRVRPLWFDAAARRWREE